ncbi:MAG TPA: lysozyme [Cyanobacteria bacterium UBA8156]|jgi:ABC-2 type transport system ATP-binding protein|nr:lysozyme [Cyanobacteria bacterium UBA8156]
MSTNAVLQVENLHKTYGDRPAVQDVSFRVVPGTIYGLLGPNGAGKTTTIRCISTLLRPDRGRVVVAGATDPRAIRRRLGYVAQEVALDKVLTGRELLALQGAMYHLPPAQIQVRIAAVLALLELTEYADRRTGTYSGGLKKRLDLAAGLLHEPQVLVLDEPTVGLDLPSRSAIWEFLRQLRQRGTAILLTSHYLEEIDALSDRVGILDRGKMVAEGTPDQLKDGLGGDRLTVKIREFADRPEAEQALKLLQGQSWVKSGRINTLQGNAINLTVARDSDTSVVRSLLTAANLPLFSLSQSRPSLDDVFLAATGQTLVDADLAARELSRK